MSNRLKPVILSLAGLLLLLVPVVYGDFLLPMEDDIQDYLKSEEEKAKEREAPPTMYEQLLFIYLRQNWDERKMLHGDQRQAEMDWEAHNRGKKNIEENAKSILENRIGKLEKQTSQMEEHPSPNILSSLLFDKGFENGIYKENAIINRETLALYKKYADSQYSFGVRIISAEFAFAVRDYKTADLICRDIINSEFLGVEMTDDRIPQEDYVLGRLKADAMRMIFYKLQNEETFRLIYAKAKQSGTLYLEIQEKRKNQDLSEEQNLSVSKDEKRNNKLGYYCFEQEEQVAESLLYDIRRKLDGDLSPE